MIYNNILETIGNTPIVRINKMGPDHVDLYVKVESFNPLASVKDRLAVAIIIDAEKRGTLKPGQTVVEATSGNTGISLAMVCAAKGYPFVATMADSSAVSAIAPESVEAAVSAEDGSAFVSVCSRPSCTVGSIACLLAAVGSFRCRSGYRSTVDGPAAGSRYRQDRARSICAYAQRSIAPVGRTNGTLCA